MINDHSKMATELPTRTNGSASNGDDSFTTKTGLARMLKGGVIMDVVNAEQVHYPSNSRTQFEKGMTDATQARIAEEAGAVAVMALERVPADIRAQGGVARMSDPSMIKEIMEVVTIPVMAKARIGHFVECQVFPPIPPASLL
jgi:pyridoxal 5'-phosphate synthase pdxS subunit